MTDLQRAKIILEVLAHRLWVLGNLLKKLIQGGKVGPVGVGSVLHEVVAVVTRLADFFPVTTGVP